MELREMRNYDELFVMVDDVHAGTRGLKMLLICPDCSAVIEDQFKHEERCQPKIIEEHYYYR